MRSRSSVALSLPALLFACLVLATNARAQDMATFQLDGSGSPPLLQILIDRQQVTNNVAASKASWQIQAVNIADGRRWVGSTSFLSVIAFQPEREVTPAQFFGNGAQAAP